MWHHLSKLLRHGPEKRVRNWQRVPEIEPMPALLAAGRAAGPDFICVGAQKAGTRWLFDQLAFHPDVWMPPIKELQYLDRSERFLKFAVPLYRRARRDLAAANVVRRRDRERPIELTDIEWLAARLWLYRKPLDLDHYARLFDLKGGRLSGDVSPGYALVPRRLAAEVRARFPSSRIVYFARDPVDRFWSQYCMVARRIPQGRPGELDSVRAFLNRRRGRDHSAIRDAVSRWRIGPGDDRFGLFFFDDLKDDPTALRSRVLAFLGADPGRVGPLSPDFNRKAEHEKIAMPGPVRDLLAEVFADEILGCAAELGGRAREWPGRYGLG
jgi:hypothetical protein